MHSIRFSRTRWGFAAAAAATLALAISAVGVRGRAPDRAAAAPGGDPSAPNAIAFDHTIHAGKYGMQCLDCHVYATESTVAGLPSLRKCMGCHKFVDKERPGVKALAALWKEGKAPRWDRVYQLPDYVYFSHRKHLAANVRCGRCHGDVAKMKRVKKVTSLSMGFCLGCHKQHNATLGCIACHK